MKSERLDGGPASDGPPDGSSAARVFHALRVDDLVAARTVWILSSHLHSVMHSGNSSLSLQFLQGLFINVPTSKSNLNL